MSDQEFRPIRTFHIDNGELGDASQQQCFVLGYELAQVDAAIESGAAMSRPIHAANKDRVFDHAKSHGRYVQISYMHDDRSESWVQFDMREAG